MHQPTPASSRTSERFKIGGFLVYKGDLFFTRNASSKIETPVTALIRGICEALPEESIAILRSRIKTACAGDSLSRGMVKVAAKRIHTLSASALLEEFLAFPGKKIEVHPPEIRPYYHPSIREGMVLDSRSLGIEPSQKGTRSVSDALVTLQAHASGRTPVSALLLDSGNRIIGISWSRTRENRTSHAELALVHRFAQSGWTEFPAGSTLWVSLRPCAMCSAIIHAFMPNQKDFRIRFLKEDPGPASKNSCLYRGSELWKASGCPEIDISLDSCPQEHKNR